MNPLHRFVSLLLFALLFALPAAPIACSSPQPVPAADGGVPVSTPDGWLTTARTVDRVLTATLPLLRFTLTTLSPLAPETFAAVDRVIGNLTTATLPAFRRSLDAYEREGGSRCAVRASVFAVMEGLGGIFDTLAAAGWGPATELRAVAGSLTGVIDALAPVCAAACFETLDAGPACRSAGDALRLRLASYPATLRPFPPLRAAPDAAAP